MCFVLVNKFIKETNLSLPTLFACSWTQTRIKFTHLDKNKRTYTIITNFEMHRVFYFFLSSHSRSLSSNNIHDCLVNSFKLAAAVSSLFVVVCTIFTRLSHIMPPVTETDSSLNAAQGPNTNTLSWLPRLYPISSH